MEYEATDETLYNPYNDINKEKSPFEIISYKKKNRARKPPPPFVTSTLQQVASTAFGWSAKKTMQVAQDIFKIKSLRCLSY